MTDWTVLLFGKHKSKTLPQVLFADPDWFFWALEKRVFEGKGKLEQEAKILARRARRIRIPGNGDGERYEAEYITHPPTGTFSKVVMVPASRPEHQGSSSVFRARYFDLSVPRSISTYDKQGYASMVRSFKFYLFGASSYRMTRKRSEEFFSDPSNFEGD